MPLAITWWTIGEYNSDSFGGQEVPCSEEETHPQPLLWIETWWMDKGMDGI